MKVIFTDKVEGVAAKGDIKNVKNGYYRNFLLPRNKAIFATEDNLKHWEEFRKKMMIEKEQLKAKFEEIKRRIEGSSVKIEKKVTTKGTLYGGVKASEVAKAIASQLKVEVGEDSVHFDSAAIKAVGTYNVRLKLGEGVETMVPVQVVEKK